MISELPDSFAAPKISLKLGFKLIPAPAAPFTTAASCVSALE